MKKPLMIATSLLLTACVSTDNQISPSSVTGTYYANLPCQGCAGVVVDLVIEADNTYSMISHPKNSNEEYFESGTWLMQGKQLHLTKTAPKATTQKSMTATIAKFTVAPEQQLILLDTSGRPYTKDAARYTFDKK